MEALIVESNKMINTPFEIVRYSNYDIELMIQIENYNFRFQNGKSHKNVDLLVR